VVKKNQKGEERGAGEHIKPIVYGGLDGIITSFATVTSVAGASLSPTVVLVLGVSHLIADGLSMGTGDAMSEQAEIDFNKSERKRERWELENNLEGEKEEMIETYTKKGVSRKDAESIIDTLAKYKRPFLDHMMVEELGLIPPEKNVWGPVKSGGVTMASFIVFGAIPLIPYLLALLPFMGDILSEKVQLWSSVIITVLSLFILGAVKGMVVKGSSWLRNGILMAMNGSFAAVLGFIVGWAMGKLVEDEAPPGAG